MRWMKTILWRGRFWPTALVEQAHAIVESDWREAEKLAREALELNPGASHGARPFAL